MKCTKCNSEIVNYPESRGYCRTCVKVETEKIKAYIKHLVDTGNKDEIDKLLAIFTAEAISRNMEY